MGKKHKRVGLLRTLLKDATANTLALGAAAIIPMIGIVGGGLDMSRIYLVKTRMQQACDAAALASTKQLIAMRQSDGTVPTEVFDTAETFFEANFENGDYGTENGSFTATATSPSSMNGVATVELPMAMMQLFGFDNFDVEVDCSAELNLPNIDVMMVLDQSGSMNGSRMNGLRQAVFSFYNAVHDAKPANARFRIGFVPYSATVNVGEVLEDSNPDWIADSWTYQSREAITELVEVTPASDGGEEQYFYGRELIPYNRSDWGNPSASLRWPSNTREANERCNDIAARGGTTYNVGGERWVIDSDSYRTWYFRNGNRNWRGACDVRIRKFRNTEPTEAVFEERFLHYEYRPIVYDTSRFKRFERVLTPTGTEGAMVNNAAWNGCIEERQTNPTTDWDTIPDDALDMDINLVPDPANPNTQWKPMWPQITFVRTGYNSQGPDVQTTTRRRNSHSFSCPSPAARMREYERSGGAMNDEFRDYVNGLTPNGGTMHDIGMIWGARFLSPEGLFAADNETAPNGDPISRHIIFMTDGEMGADPRNYTAYGNANMDGRFMGFKAGGRWTEPETAAVNNARLAALCERVKNQNITIWTVTFGLDQNQFTRGCASGNARALEAANSAELSTRFQEIASAIAELRLVN